ncbi:MAG: hypothetical protein AB8B61_06420 [Cyclobacteriaceae bacterium]
MMKQSENPFISTENKLLITGPFSRVILNYTTQVLKKEFFLTLLETCYDWSGNEVAEKHILLHWGESTPTSYVPTAFQGTDYATVVPFIESYISSLSESSLQAWYYTVLNSNYEKEIEQHTDSTSPEETYEKISEQFGREMAYQLYDPKESGLNDSLKNYLLSLIISFSQEVDTSQIDHDFIEECKETINSLTTIV